MCDKCKMMGSVGNCENQKAMMYMHPCPGIHGMDVHECPWVEVIRKKCDDCDAVYCDRAEL